VTHTTVPAEPFQLLADHIALDFANTLDRRFSPEGPLELLTSYDRVLAFCEQTRLLSESEAARLGRDVSNSEAAETLTRAIELREAVYSLGEAVAHATSPPTWALRTLNQLLRATHRSRVVAWDSSRFVWRTEGGELEAMTPLLRIAERTADLLTSADATYIKECGVNTCRWLFLDRSRNHSRRWCDMSTCGNRAKARRFQTRAKGRGRTRPR
jgi:predicted RNA-binding Zn ribbon-like protein